MAEKNFFDKLQDIKQKISQDRERTNILRKYEQTAIAYLVQKIPNWVTPDMLTFVGFSGNATVGLSLYLAYALNKYWLFLSALGFFMSWFGDSLDGRLAYYRNKPRKWYGFCLDLTTDWLGIILMGLGAFFYFPGFWKIAVYLFVTLYGWEIITALLRFKVTGKYSIDSGYFGPTEVRILLLIIFITEIYLPGTIMVMSIIGILGIIVSNFIETFKLLKFADNRDREERKNNTAKS